MPIGRIFVDTSAYCAATDEFDQQHIPAVSAMRRLIDDRCIFFTSNFVLAELHALIISRIDRAVAIDTLIDLLVSEQVVNVTALDHSRAMKILITYDDKSFTLTDACSFAIMERLGIESAFTFDRHYEQFGWNVIPSLPPR